jgi:pyrroline-5-carboxylate reductase
MPAGTTRAAVPRQQPFEFLLDFQSLSCLDDGGDGSGSAVRGSTVPATPASNHPASSARGAYPRAMTVRLAVIGGGNMGAALVGGLLAAGWAQPDELAVVEPLATRRAELATQFPGVRVSETLDTAADGAVLATKPAQVAAAATIAAPQVNRLLSIAAGVSTAAIEQACGKPLPVVRAMPNTPALVGAGASAIAAGAHAAPEDLAWAESILASVGTVVRLPEHLLDAVTGLSGSGPAYVFLLAEALVEAGVLVGLPREVSAGLTVQLLVGSAQMLATGQSPESLRAAVTSPGGTTAAALEVLEERAVRAAFLAAVRAATERSRELGA